VSGDFFSFGGHGKRRGALTPKLKKTPDTFFRDFVRSFCLRSLECRPTKIQPRTPIEDREFFFFDRQPRFVL
jgi:hypothetical protein